jgi:hypothetical protein
MDMFRQRTNYIDHMGDRVSNFVRNLEYNMYDVPS